MEVELYTAVFPGTEQSPVTITLYPEQLSRFGQAALVVLHSDSEAVREGESPIQLLESCEYEYELSETDLKLTTDAETHRIVSESKAGGSVCFGRLRPGQNVGNLELVLKKASGDEVSRLSLEVRSGKLGYRNDYRRMLEYITDRCVHLILALRSPSSVRLIPDPGSDIATIGQRFAFLRSLVGSREFKDAITRITVSPHHRLERYVNRVPITSKIKSGKQVAREIVRGNRRVNVPTGHPLRERDSIPSVPEFLRVIKRQTTIDTAENRFVKFALESFSIFLDSMKERLHVLGEKPCSPLNKGIRSLNSDLQSVLTRPFFRGLSEPHMVPIGSPVLQRKGGYREVLKAWLNFSLAARLCWSGGDDVFKAGQRDVATLYEYWVFFKLLDLMEQLFSLSAPPVEDLISVTADGFGLRLKSGHHLALKGTYKSDSRALSINFSYNRTFSRSGPPEAANYPMAGSWTAGMRPDYTLSIWPNEFTEVEAERQELIIHIHFDAKYRVADLVDLFGKTDDELKGPAIDSELSQEKSDQRAGRYKRADLLKMHAYNDAIRRTAGAYVIYPGTERRAWRGFHEILPGLGAFPLRPTGKESDDGSREIKEFLLQVIENVCSRSTARERETYHKFVIHEQPQTLDIFARTPERMHADNRRHLPLSETQVLVIRISNNDHLKWVKESGKYGVSLTQSQGLPYLTGHIAGAMYLLLINSNGEPVDGLFRTSPDGPTVYSREELLLKGCPSSLQSDYYLVYDVEESADFRMYRWSLASVPNAPEGDSSAIPFTVTLDTLMKTAVRKKEY